MDIDHESEQDPQDTDAYRSTQDDMRRVAEQMRQTAREMRKGVVQTREEMQTMRDSLRGYLETTSMKDNSLCYILGKTKNRITGGLVSYHAFSNS